MADSTMAKSISISELSLQLFTVSPKKIPKEPFQNSNDLKVSEIEQNNEPEFVQKTTEQPVSGRRLTLSNEHRELLEDNLIQKRNLVSEGSPLPSKKEGRASLFKSLRNRKSEQQDIPQSEPKKREVEDEKKIWENEKKALESAFIKEKKLYESKRKALDDEKKAFLLQIEREKRSWEEDKKRQLEAILKEKKQFEEDKKKTIEALSKERKNFLKEADLIKKQLEFEKKRLEKIKKKEEKKNKKEKKRNSEIVLSEPRGFVQKAHVDGDYKWSGNPKDLFEFEGQLGKGAYGSVFKAKHKETEFSMAIKVLPIESGTDISEIEKEIEILKKCKSPNIVSYFGTCSVDKNLWNMFRSQEHGESHNVLMGMLNFFASLEKKMNISSNLEKMTDENLDINVRIAYQAVNAINEALQGPNIQSQTAVLESNRFFTPVRNLLEVSIVKLHKKAETDPVVAQDVLKLMNSVITLLLSFLEGDASPEIVSEVSQSVGISEIIDNLLSVRELAAPSKKEKEKKEANKEEKQKLIRTGLSFYILARKLIDIDDDDHIIQNPQWTKISEFFDQYVGRIEVIRSGTLERVYFPIPQISLDLWSTSQIYNQKEVIVYTVQRENNYEKIEDFYDKSRSLIMIMKRNWHLEGKDKKQKKDEPEVPTPPVTATLNQISLQYASFNKAFWWMALLANFLLVIGYSTGPGVKNHSNQVNSALLYWRIIYSFCGIILTLISVARLYSFIQTFGIVRLQSEKLSSKGKEVSSEDEEAGFLEADVNRPLNWREFLPLLSWGTPRVLLAFAIISLISIFNPMMFCFLLADALVRFRVLNKFLTVVFKNNSAILLQTVFAGMLLTFIFAVLGFWLFEFDYVNNDEFYCDSLWRCFLRHFIDGNRQGGGIADLMNEPTYGTLHFYGRQLFDIFFYCIIIVIITAVISGIVIDAFGAIRDEESSSQEDMKSKCFICSLENGLFERHAEGFQKHIQEDHNMWMYVFFMLHLDQTDPSEYSAQEAYVFDMLKTRNLTFFPIGRALVLDGKITNSEKDE